MTQAALRLPDDSPIPALAEAVAGQGGRLVVVGGWVRDALKARASGDLDLEVFGLDRETAGRLFEARGFTPPVGRQFPVWRRSDARLDVAFPREGAQDYRPDDPESLDAAYARAARHRDLRVNAIAWDPLCQRLVDPFDGRADLAAGRLRAVDAETFGADPLRGLRLARLAATLEAQIEPELMGLCAALERARLDDLPVERVAGELRRMLIEPERPALAFEAMAASGLLEGMALLAPIAALRGVPQDPRWHPEGDVWLHTLMVLDAAAAIARPLDDDARSVLMFAALCHDFGKPDTTSVEGERVRALGHEGRGARLAADWLAELRLGRGLLRAVEVLVANHLAPAQYVSQSAGPRGYRRLARRLAKGGMTVIELERLARADHLGRTTPEALAGGFEAGERFLARAREIGVAEGVEPDVVDAAELMRQGIPAGPALGRLIVECREMQDETGWRDAERIIARVLGRHPELATSDPVGEPAEPAEPGETKESEEPRRPASDEG